MLDGVGESKDKACRSHLAPSGICAVGAYSVGGTVRSWACNSLRAWDVQCCAHGYKSRYVCDTRVPRVLAPTQSFGVEQGVQELIVLPYRS